MVIEGQSRTDLVWGWKRSKLAISILLGATFFLGRRFVKSPQIGEIHIARALLG